MSTISDRLPYWRLWVPLAGQVLIILAIALPVFFVLWQGKVVVLQTVPIDPYDYLRGYSQTLSYDISRYETMAALPGWNTVEISKNDTDQSISFYLTLEAPQSNRQQGTPQPWQPLRISKEAPQNLAENQAVLRGTLRYKNIIYGLETFYFPEDQRNQINQEINAANRLNTATGRQTGVAEIRTNAWGKGVLAGLWILGKKYSF